MLPQFDITFYFSQLFWLFVCFAILILAFKKLFIPRMNFLLSSRDNHIEKAMEAASKLEAEVIALEDEIKKLHAEELKRSAEITRDAMKRADSLLNDQVQVIKEEHDGLINATRRRMSDEIRSLESFFRIQVEITAHTVFEKLFTQRN